MSMFEKWKNNETIQVLNPSNGLVFSIKPEQWAGITIGYTVLVDGNPVPDNTRKMMGDADFRDWVSNLVEVEDDAKQ